MVGCSDSRDGSFHLNIFLLYQEILVSNTVNFPGMKKIKLRKIVEEKVIKTLKKMLTIIKLNKTKKVSLFSLILRNFLMVSNSVNFPGIKKDYGEKNNRGKGNKDHEENVGRNEIEENGGKEEKVQVLHLHYQEDLDS